jgi:hypothetical protein
VDPSPDRVGGRAGAYATAWVAGLAVWPSNLDVTSSDTKVMSAYTGHRGVAMAQYLLVEGVAAIALAVVAIALGRAALLAASLLSPVPATCCWTTGSPRPRLFPCRCC